MPEETPHKRRVRYKGTHPTKFHEKYKEANPEKYADTIEKVISKGSTPAGMHISIMVNEILDVLNIQPGEQGLDATLGYGGHTKAMLGKLEGKGRMVALDVDPIEIEKTKARLKEQGFGEDILTIKKINFAKIAEVEAEEGKFDFVLADLGVSSMQIDNPERGFSYKVDAPLDLRLDPQHGESAADRLAHITRDEFIYMMVENSDEPFAEAIANKVFEKKKKGNPVRTTQELKNAIEEAVLGELAKKKGNGANGKNNRNVQGGMENRNGQDKRYNNSQGKKDNYSKGGNYGKSNNNMNVTSYAKAEKSVAISERKLTPDEEVKKACARVFQALRIDVNSEFEVLYQFLDSLPDILNDGARVAILTFHSGEDRLVKKAFKQGYKDGIYSEISEDVIRPSQEECNRNPRAKSTKLRYAVKA